MAATPTLSDTTGVSSVMRLSDFDVASDVMSESAVMLGAVVSTIVTFWVAVAEFPAASVAVHVIVVSPSENAIGESLVIDDSNTASAAVASPKITELLSADVASIVMSVGAVMLGAVVSVTVIF